MNPSSIAARAFEAFRDDVAVPPALTLRGGCAVDSYDEAGPFDAVLDQATDGYLERFTFWGLAYLDARSWRHYLPRLIDYAVRTPEDPAMVVEALVRSFRPPDRYPPRLATLDGRQEDVVRAFLEQAALTDALPHVKEDAQQALEEWWLPNAPSRLTPADIDLLRARPVSHRVVTADVYRVSIPETLVGSGMRVIPEESRRTEVWGGLLCGDAHTVVAVNVTPLRVRSLDESVIWRQALFREPVRARSTAVLGAPAAKRMDGLTPGASPAEPQTLVRVFAIAGHELVTLSIRSWPRDDLTREVERIAASLEIVRSL